MDEIHIVRCYVNQRLVRSELCMSLWEADLKAKEYIEIGHYDEVKIVRQGEENA